jgi:hypothetical protein
VQKPASPAKARRQPVAARITLTEAFQQLLQRFEPHAAREQLDAAIRTNKVRLWVGDKVVDPNFFTTHLRVAAHIAPDGRWSAEIEATRALEPGPYVWTVASEDISPLAAEPARHPGGRRPKYDREFIQLEVSAWVMSNGLPDSYSQIIADLRKEHGDKIPEDSQAKDIIRPVLQRLKVELRK